MAAKVPADVIWKIIIPLLTAGVEARNSNTQRKLWNEIRAHIPALKDVTFDILESANSAEKARVLLAESQTDAAICFQIMAKAVSASARGTAADISEASNAVRFMAEGVSGSAQSVARDLNGVRIMAGSMADQLSTYARFMTIGTWAGVRALHVIGDQLGQIKDELGLSNALHVRGSKGEAGFAQHVYDFVQMRIDEVSGPNEIEKHRFFV